MTATPSSSTATRPDHAGLTPAQFEELARTLAETQATLHERARVVADYDGSFDATAATSSHGETEHTTIDIERRVNAVLEANTRHALAEIESAVARMEDGTYGLCANCRSQIPFERLAAMAAARFCVRCQQHRDLDG
jgi:DnaK suppressor protein